MTLWVAGHRRICPHNPNLFLLFNPAFTPLPLTFAIIVRLLLYIKLLQQRCYGGSSNHFFLSLSRQARLYIELARRRFSWGGGGSGPAICDSLARFFDMTRLLSQAESSKCAARREGGGKKMPDLLKATKSHNVRVRREKCMSFSTQLLSCLISPLSYS